MSKHGKLQRHDSEFRGPIQNRGCTDVLCLVLFAACIGGWCVVAGFAFANGDPRKFYYPTECTGRRCGYDEGVKEKPYLFFFDPRKCIHSSTLKTGCPTTQICVSKCPNESVALLKSTSEYLGNETYWHDYCKESTDFRIDVNKLVEKGDCPEYIIECRHQFFHRCIPTGVRNMAVKSINVVKPPEMENVTLGPINRNVMPREDIVKQAAAAMKKLTKMQEVVREFVEDLKQSWHLILCGLGAGMVVCLIWIVLMRYLAGIMTWFALFGAIAILAAGCWFSGNEYVNAKRAEKKGEEVKSLIPIGKTAWLVILIILSSTLGILLLLIILMWGRIRLAITLMKEGSKAVVGTLFTPLLFPVIPFIMQLAMIAFTLTVAVFLATSGEFRYQTSWDRTCKSCPKYMLNDTCIPEDFYTDCHDVADQEDPSCKYECRFSSVEVPERYNVMQYYSGFMGLWALFFISSLEEMVLAGTFASWYWILRKRDLPCCPLLGSMFRAFRYHTGTLAFGSLILAVIRSFRIILEYINQKLRGFENSATNIVVSGVKCCTSCLEGILQFLNTNAIIMCAIHGKNFCRSSKDAFSLLMKNSLRAFSLRIVTTLGLTLSKLVVVTVTVILSWAVLKGKFGDYLQPPSLTNEWIPIAVIAFGTYCIACLFFSVYATAVDTLFLCVLEDLERNDGSKEKPYFMSKQVWKVVTN